MGFFWDLWDFFRVRDFFKWLPDRITDKRFIFIFMKHSLYHAKLEFQDDPK